MYLKPLFVSFFQLWIICREIIVSFIQLWIICREINFEVIFIVEVYFLVPRTQGNYKLLDNPNPTCSIKKNKKGWNKCYEITLKMFILPFFACFFLFFSFFWWKKMWTHKTDYFDQPMAYTAPVCCSKFTTYCKSVKAYQR